jgi:hypothetical protein
MEQQADKAADGGICSVTPAQQAKEAGLKSLKQASEMTGKPSATL